jgi:hypothetical protein
VNTKKSDIKYSNIALNVLIPINCPHCGAFVEPKFIQSVAAGYNDKSSIFLATFRVECCDKLFFAVYQRFNQELNAQLLYVYPPYIPETLPASIHQISPRFVEIYKQSHFAEENNFFELAGSGYRNSIEVLIKDYAINELSKPEKEVKSKKLYNAIGDYLPNERLMSTADVVRILGNDNTHYERKYSSFDIDILKRYLTIFISQIDTEYLISHPPVKANRN